MIRIITPNGVLIDTYQAIIEKRAQTDLYVGYIPVYPKAHSQGKTLDELNDNLREVVEMLLEDGESMRTLFGKGHLSFSNIASLKAL